MRDSIDYEDIARQMVRHENELMNHRITWLLGFEGLLFTALSFAWDKSEALVYVLCFVGAIVAGSCLPSLDGAQRALSHLKGWWDKNRPMDYTGPGVVGFWREGTFHRIILPWHVFPVLFFVAWATVAIINYERSTNRLAATEIQQK